MTKNTKIYFLSLIIILVGAFGVGFFVKNSFSGEKDINKKISSVSEEMLGYYSLNDKETVDKYFDNSLDTLGKLEKETDVILKVKVIERKLFFRSTESKSEVLKVFKGEDDIKEGGIIYIHEPFSVNGDTVFSTCGYNMMKNNNEYIVFLKHLKKMEGYKYPDKEKISFLPVSTLYAKYSEKENAKFLNSDKENGNKYKDVKEFCSIFELKEDLEKYEKIKKQILNKYK